MNIERGIFEQSDSVAEAEADAHARADVLAGRVVPHHQVAAWLRTWGTPDEGPPPAEWFK